MIELGKIEVFNFEGAIRGLRNPMNSWHKSDSIFGAFNEEDVFEKAFDVAASYIHSDLDEEHDKWNNWMLDNGTNLTLLYGEHYQVCSFIGAKDLELAQKMVSAGTDESKFMRQIFVSMDIEAPLYWWKEMDTYKVATVANSCSTMHKLATTPITQDCFSFDEELDDLDTQFYGQEVEGFSEYFSLGLMNKTIISTCERLRKKYLETKDVRYWRALIQLLPESWNQKRTWTANYQTLRAIYFARRHHRLSEWVQFTDMILTLPYAKELITIE